MNLRIESASRRQSANSLLEGAALPDASARFELRIEQRHAFANVRALHFLQRQARRLSCHCALDRRLLDVNTLDRHYIHTRSASRGRNRIARTQREFAIVGGSHEELIIDADSTFENHASDDSANAIHRVAVIDRELGRLSMHNTAGHESLAEMTHRIGFLRPILLLRQQVQERLERFQA